MTWDDRTSQTNGPVIPERQLAGRWGKSVRTLQRWRYQRRGPAYLQIGGSVYYTIADILAFERSARRPGGSGE